MSADFTSVPDLVAVREEAGKRLLTGGYYYVSCIHETVA